jgi:dTDP-4-dehydrorhamnose reductase
MGTTQKRQVKNITILGANGQLGKVIHYYLRNHYPQTEINACVRQLPDNRYKNDYVAFTPFTDNWLKLGKTDVLINCIGIIKESNALSFELAHVGLTQLMLQHRQLLGNPKIIQISALGANPDNQIRFLSTKGKADELLLKEPHTIVVRPSIVCTPDTMIMQKLKMLTRMSRYLFNYLPFPEKLLPISIQPIMPEDLAGIVAKLCFMDHYPEIVDAVGPNEISWQEFINMANPKIKLLPVSRSWANFYARLIDAMCPSLLSYQQYKLLHYNNTACSKNAEQLLGKALQTTKLFWHVGLQQKTTQRNTVRA